MRIVDPAGFYVCYLKYRANKNDILTLLSELDTPFKDISDENYVKTNGREIFEHLEFINNRMPKFRQDIEFFFELQKLEEIEFYRCNKYPKANHLAVDVETNTIYHLITKYWD